MSVEVGAWATPWTILVSVNLGFTPYGNRTWQGHFPLDPQKHETRDAGDTAFWMMSTPKNSTPGLLCICAIFLPFLRKTSLIHQSGFVNPGLGFLIKKKTLTVLFQDWDSFDSSIDSNQPNHWFNEQPLYYATILSVYLYLRYT